ncbi:MAG: metalloregulator ArsR/SmtB family transcription factor [Actinobacteria bacterium]|nr:metalloregulator ArsR/SmtB family transcription factor [Actinomycetota bacterium]
MQAKDLKNIEKIIKALADENRIRILCLLKSRQILCVCEIQEIIRLSQPTISSHLKILENAGLIENEKVGLWVNYRIKEGLKPFEKDLMELLAKNLINDSQIKKDSGMVKKIDRVLICCKKKKE